MPLVYPLAAAGSFPEIVASPKAVLVVEKASSSD